VNIVYLEGCQRSGNHILVQWMQGFMPYSTFVENACYSIEEQKDNAYSDVKSQTVADGAAFTASAIKNPKFTHAVVSTEHPGLLTYAEIDTLIDASNPRFKNIARLSLIRDPLNWMASYAKLRAGFKLFGMQNQHGAKTSQIYSNYTMYHEEYWNRWYRSYLRWKDTPEKYRVHYNLFISDVNYRQNLAQTLGLAWNKADDEKLMSKQAKHGSSFTKEDSSSTFLNRFGYMIPMFMAHPLPYHIIKAAKDDFPVIYEVYEKAMIAADL
jgi:hypothetical protein